MRIPRIYDSKMQTQLGSELQLDESGANHVSKVLRLKTGDLIRVFDGRGHEFEASLVQVGKKTVVTLSRELTNNSESPLWVELLQVISRGDRMDFTLQKAVELGVSKIIPLTSERCGVKLDGERAAKKIESYQKLVISACEQCGRAVVPQVAPSCSHQTLPGRLGVGKDQRIAAVASTGNLGLAGISPPVNFEQSWQWTDQASGSSMQTPEQQSSSRSEFFAESHRRHSDFPMSAQQGEL